MKMIEKFNGKAIIYCMFLGSFNHTVSTAEVKWQDECE
jgi:hypothetical protein